MIRLVPGPGNYQSNYHNVVKSAPKYGFGTGQRENSEEKLKASLPGPGTYDRSSVIGRDGPSKTMGAK